MSAISNRQPAGAATDIAPLRVLVADDHPLMLAGIRRALERSENIQVVGEARTGPELMDLVGRRRPQVVFMDLRMPGVVGNDCIAELRASWPEITVVVLSASEDRATIDGALTAGASAYIVKSVVPSDIASVLRQAASGGVFHGTSSARTAASRGPRAEPEAPALTQREGTILEAVAAGKTTAAISLDLWVSEHTVKFHLTNIYRKLGVPNRAAAVRYALEHGLLDA